MKSVIRLTCIILFLIAVAYGLRTMLNGQVNKWVCQNGEWVALGNPSSAIPSTTCTGNQNGVSIPTETVKEKNIIVSKPTANEEIGLPVIIEGEARVFENNLSYRVRGENDSILVEGFTTADAPDIGKFGKFKVETNYAEGGKEGFIEVFNYSAKDGSEENKITIPVKFKETESQIVKVYFSNEERNPNFEDCGLVYAVNRRIPKTVSVARASLEELLKGPMPGEFELGYETSINMGVKIQKLTIENGVAKVDFNQLLQESIGGSCKVLAIRAQITQTLKQFPTVKEVVISIDGNTEEILQP